MLSDKVEAECRLAFQEVCQGRREKKIECYLFVGSKVDGRLP